MGKIRKGIERRMLGTNVALAWDLSFVKPSLYVLEFTALGPHPFTNHPRLVNLLVEPSQHEVIYQISGQGLNLGWMHLRRVGVVLTIECPAALLPR